MAKDVRTYHPTGQVPIGKATAHPRWMGGLSRNAKRPGLIVDSEALIANSYPCSISPFNSSSASVLCLGSLLIRRRAGFQVFFAVQGHIRLRFPARRKRLVLRSGPGRADRFKMKWL